MQSNSEKYDEISLQTKEDVGFSVSYSNLTGEQRYFVDNLLEKGFQKANNYGIIIEDMQLAIGDLQDTRNNLVILLDRISGDVNE